MRPLLACLTGCLVYSGLLGPAMQAQVTNRIRLTDARMVEMVGSAALNHYTFLVIRTAFERDSTVFDIQVPTTGPVEEWNRLAAHFATLLRARPKRDSDDNLRQLHIEEVMVSRDTLRAFISTGVARNCRPGWYEDRTSREVIWVHAAEDQWLLVSDKPRLFSESFGRCPGENNQ